ncbi:MAG TPA: TlpA disulfide reductase family protein [Rhizomicrobium sp.]|jgi:thiol-disulfide isomerase/thioredoxin|nr:TlpA disulfide reductase family protein [Rhizomicrobium sp.]
MPRLKPLYLAIAAVIAFGAILAVVYVKRSGPVHATTPPATMAHFALSEHAPPLPDVAFSDARGVRHTLEEYRGRYVLLNLWATWCAPCVKELPSLAKLQKAMGDKLAVVAVDVGRNEALDAAQFMKSHGAGALPVFLDSNVALVRAFKAYGLPLTVLIDPNGKEVGRASGEADWGAADSVKYLQAITARASS